MKNRRKCKLIFWSKHYSSVFQPTCFCSKECSDRKMRPMRTFKDFLMNFIELAIFEMYTALHSVHRTDTFATDFSLSEIFTARSRSLKFKKWENRSFSQSIHILDIKMRTTYRTRSGIFLVLILELGNERVLREFLKIC